MGASLLTVDYALAMADGLGSEAGLQDRELDELAPRFARACEAVLARARRGELGFFFLPQDRGAVRAVEELATGLRTGVEEVLVLGIGGSSLGARALLEALRPPPATQAPGSLRLHLPDNSDPWLLSHLLGSLDPRKSAALVVSKSGGTVETAAQMLIVREWLRAAGGEQALRERMVAITDPERGSLRERASREGWRTLPIPSNVGGRFSVLTAAGLLPAALAGIDVDGLRRGAEAMAERCQSPVLRENPAGVLAAVCHLHHVLRGRSVHVLMPYGDRLRAFAAWYVQLWAESLGKRLDRGGKRVETGPTPLPAVGATDQHAQMQLFMEGPRDKLLTFVAIEEREPDLRIPQSGGADAYLAGRTLGELLAAEREGTTEALASDGRPSLTVSLPRLDALQLGALMFLYQAATAFAGELYDVDAFDQPGVELGKRLAFASLGRSGYEQEAAQLQSRKATRSRNYSL